MSKMSPNTDNYQIAKGILYFDRFDADDNLTGEMDLGNDPSFVLTPGTESLDHFSSRDGLKRKDKVAVIQASVDGKFTLDEINIENLMLAFMGGTSDYITQSGATVSGESVTAHTNKYSKLLYRKLLADSISISGYVEDTDFTVDYDIGRIKVLSTGSISENEVLSVTYTYETCAYPVVNIAKDTQVEGLLRFVGDCTLGFDYEIVLWKVKLSASGDINFIGDTWNQIEFTFNGLDDSANHPDSPWGQIIDSEGDISVES